MSESAAKAKRRDLRRVIGRAAITDFGQLEEAVRTLGTAVNEQRQAIKQIAEHQTALDMGITAVAADAVCAYQVTSRYGLRKRLRWLFTGK